METALEMSAGEKAGYVVVGIGALLLIAMFLYYFAPRRK